MVVQIRIIIALILISAGMISCTGKNVTDKSESAIDNLEGWINDDTYQLAAGGIPVRSLKMIDQRKESARLDAILNAQYQIIMQFTGLQIKRKELKNINLGEAPVSNELKSILRQGIVKKTVWDYEENCELLFEIKYPGLKAKVIQGAWR